MPLNWLPIGQRPSLPRHQPDIGCFIRDLRQLMGWVTPRSSFQRF